MGNNVTPYIIATGEENTNFFTPQFNFFGREKINDNELIKSNGNSVDPFDYHVLNCGKYSFKILRQYKIHPNYN